MGVTSILSRTNTPQNVYKCLIIKNVLRNEFEQLVYVVVVTTHNALISFPRDVPQFEQITSRSKAVYHFPPFQLSGGMSLSKKNGERKVICPKNHDINNMEYDQKDTNTIKYVH